MRAPLGATVLALALACSDASVRVEEAKGAAVGATSPAPPAPPPQPSVRELEGGLVVEVVEPGSGAPARRGCELLVHYRAHLAGAERPFDSSWSRGVPDRWRLSASGRPRLIEGLARGLVGVPAGSRAVLRIPATLGWGEAGFAAAGVPPDADLVYEVHILEVR